MPSSFIFDLGTISVEQDTLLPVPEFDADISAGVVGDVLLQFEWSRTLGTASPYTDLINGATQQGAGLSAQPGDWANLFLFTTDASSMSDLAPDDIEYKTVKGNWNAKSLTRQDVDAYRVPSDHGHIAGGATVNSINVLGGADDSTNLQGGTLDFTRVGPANTGYFNKPQESCVKNKDKLPVSKNHASDMNMAGEYSRYYSYKLFGDRPGPGLDLFSNEEDIITAVKNADASLNESVMGHLKTSNDNAYIKDNTNIPHMILTSLLADASGQDRVKTIMESDTVGAANGYYASDQASVKSTQDGVAISATDCPNSWHRIPLKEGDRLRIKVKLTESTAEPNTFNTDIHVTDRYYVVEYKLIA